MTSAAPLAQGPLGALRQISEQRLYMIAGGALLALGVVVALVAAVQYLIAAFNVGFWWGLGCVFLAPVSLVFLVLHWKVAKRPFLVSCLGTVIAGVGGVLLVGM